MSSEAFLGVGSSLGGRNWRARPLDEALAAEHVQRLGVPDLVGRILAARGVEALAGESFLEPRLKSLFPDPSLFADMDKAAACMLDALQSERNCAVFGDYDADGGCAAALLTRYFRQWGKEITLYIPDRFEEGYGPSSAAFERLKRDGVDLIITVDCGASANAPIAAGRDMGLDILVLDHHLMHGPLPPALAVVNPNREDCTSGCGYLAGVGVVFVLIAAVNRLARAQGVTATPPDPRQWLDICALGTLCDVVPLTGLNRAIVRTGLRLMGEKKNTGIAALAAIARIDRPNTVRDAVFALGPRLNAGGRLDDPSLAAKLLSTDDPDTAHALAERLDARNEARKAIEAEILSHACAQAEHHLAERPDSGILVVGDENWHPGVVGIVASRLKERFFLPTIVFGWGKEFGPLARGSGRSIPGVNLGHIVACAVKDGLLGTGGGHPMAAGMSIRPEAIPAFRAAMERPLHDSGPARKGARILDIDILLTPGAATAELLRMIERIGPFGAGAPEPVAVLAHIRPDRCRRVGGDHLAFAAHGEDGKNLRCIAFRTVGTPLGQALEKGQKLHLAGRLGADAWRGSNAVQFEVIDGANPVA